MASIYTIEEIKPPLERIGTWSTKHHMIFRMVFHPSSIPNYQQLIHWALRQPRSRPFPKETDFRCSITSHYEGSVVLQGLPHDGIPHIKYYDVRVYTQKDAEYFRECWKIDPKTYKENLAHEIERENRKNGHIVINGRGYGIHELEPIEKELHNRRTRKAIREGTKLAKELSEKGSIRLKLGNKKKR